MLENILLYSFVSISVVHVFFILINWKFIFTTETAPSNKTGAVSVVVCAKNEENTLPSLLASLKEQNYSNFEIVLVNDASRDKTLEIFENFASNNSNVKVVDVAENDRFWKGKKFALTLGIKSTNNDYLLFTDADCVPVSKNWISFIMSGYQESKDVVLGYGAYKKTNGLLNKLIRFETIITASNYFSYAKFFTPYMGVGRNLSYKKDLFFENNGFYGHMDVASGDDDLFINKNATRKNTEIVFSSDSKTISEAPNTWKAWINQKRRHYTSSSLYSNKTKGLLGLQAISQALFYIFTIVLLIFDVYPIIIWSILLFRTIIFAVTIGSSASKLKEKDLIILAPIFDIILIIFQLIILISNKVIYPKRWT